MEAEYCRNVTAEKKKNGWKELCLGFYRGISTAMRQTNALQLAKMSPHPHCVGGKKYTRLSRLLQSSALVEDDAHIASGQV